MMAGKILQVEITSKESRSNEEIQKVPDGTKDKSKGVKSPYGKTLWKYTRMLTSNKRLIFIKELVIMVALMLVLPTVDTSTDIHLTVIWWFTRRPWAICSLCILLIHTVSLAIVWWYLEPRQMKKFSWIFVLLQVYPQYRATIIIYRFVKDTEHDDTYEEEVNLYDKMIRTIEPYMESAPQLVLFTASFFSAYGRLTGNLDDTKAMEQVTGYKNENSRAGYFDIPVYFYFKLALSCFSTSLGVTMFFKCGPARFLPPKGPLSLDFLAAFVGTTCLILWRLTMLIMMISSSGYLIPTVYPVPSPASILTGSCKTIVGVETVDFLALRKNKTQLHTTQWNCKHCHKEDMFY